MKIHSTGFIFETMEKENYYTISNHLYRYLFQWFYLWKPYKENVFVAALLQKVWEYFKRLGDYHMASLIRKNFINMQPTVSKSAVLGKQLTLEFALVVPNSNICLLAADALLINTENTQKKSFFKLMDLKIEDLDISMKCVIN